LTHASLINEAHKKQWGKDDNTDKHYVNIAINSTYTAAVLQKTFGLYRHIM